ncbi:PDR/VanB family oxidoreductase [Demequina zhanjiangensis]|uniref:PDR/VanB family oxidoreductase n=1 Tax=Demequina zhanjiangensis TaxID=3051659 RepID=A0ABT8G4B7_9MICO|nr:PDR/VanB family oxidoreductase [Demequina sp. SYSU T00b26]MDN4473986.1 PDR/VanB family oxidoreductase [Demequina sp. SYSU T00b26]
MTVPPPLRDAVVVARRRLASEVDAFELAAADGSPLGAWAPGAHLDVVLPDGTERQYSLCGDASTSETWTIAVLREDDGRGGSHWIHENLHEGARIQVRGPWNHFALAAAPRYRFLAGGIGITPLLPMIAAADAAGARWTLDYAGRSRETMAFLPELETHGAKVRVHAADEGARLDIDALFPAPGELVFACGPQRMLDALDQAARTWAPEALHVERFEAREVGEPVLHESFEVELAISGTTVTVDPDTSVLDAVESAGVFVLSSCREGTCGTCETPVMEGEVDHRDSILSPAEQDMNDRMMICVSRASCPRLVLEL